MRGSNMLTDTIAVRLVVIAGVVLLVLLGSRVALGSPEQAPNGDHFVQISEQGFGDRQNSFAWSMQWWNGKLYVGTGRSFFCVGAASYDAEMGGNTYPPDFLDVECAPTPQDLDLRAEIWRYTPETQTWERVYQSPNDVPIPDHPGKFVARDIGFRDMVVFTEPDGTEALYVAGVSSRSFNPGVPPPRILRSVDGVHFEPVPQDPGTFLGDLPVEVENIKAGRSFRAMAVYKGRLYVTVSDYRGVGGLIESANPAGGNDNFRQVSPPDMKVWELQVFNDHLYVGLSASDGYAVVKTDATGEPPYEFVPIVTEGGFREPRWKRSREVLSMHVFDGKLYVGTNRPAEMIRISPDDSWELVVGEPRDTPQGFKQPISGQSTGFGNPFTDHFWRMQEHEGRLYVGTWDASIYLRIIPILDPIFIEEYGFDLFATPDGTFWYPITRNGFGDGFNQGARTFASTPFGLIVGTANPYHGTQIWQVTPKDLYHSYLPLIRKSTPGDENEH